jgi:hypothetical protein
VVVDSEKRFKRLLLIRAHLNMDAKIEEGGSLNPKTTVDQARLWRACSGLTKAISLWQLVQLQHAPTSASQYEADHHLLCSVCLRQKKKRSPDYSIDHKVRKALALLGSNVCGCHGGHVLEVVPFIAGLQSSSRHRLVFELSRDLSER